MNHSPPSGKEPPAGGRFSTEAAIDWLDRNEADVVVMDLAMPGLNGMEATAQIAKKHPRLGVVMLSMHQDESYVLRCLRSGARGYVLKESAENELIAAVREVAAARSFFSPKIAGVLRSEHVERLRREGIADSFELLTAREREILQMIAEGNANKEIAGRLSISTLTVETHRKKILDKLGLHGAADLILYAVRKGIVQ